ncbi:MAG: GntR family transcriptional regulator [Phycisphaerales bacterium JB063]
MNASLSDKAYRRVLADLHAGILKSGDRISEVALSTELKISRTPLREAIRKLQSDGLVEQVPKVGTFIRTPSRRELLDLFEQREALESYLARKVAEQANPELADELLALNAQMRALVEQGQESGGVKTNTLEAQKMRDLDLAFHDTLARAAGNQTIYRTLFDGRLMSWVFVGRARNEHYVPSDEHRKALQEHEVIANAIKCGNPEQAYRAMSEHLRLASQRTVANLDRQHAIPGQGLTPPLPGGFPDAQPEPGAGDSK